MPLLFDMSWEELQTYEGRNPKPADFDSFWDKGLREIDAIDPQTELTPSAFWTPTSSSRISIESSIRCTNAKRRSSRNWDISMCTT